MKFTIKDRITTAEPNAVLSYALDYRAEFEVDDEWADKVITARFVHSNGEYIDVVLDNFGCNIPLFPKGVLWVGAYTDAFTSTAVPVPIGVTIKDLGEHEAIPPTADVYQQIIALIEAGRLKGDKGEPGEDYIITESDYQAIAERVPQPDLTEYVKNTDYATTDANSGVLKVNTYYGASVVPSGSDRGMLRAVEKTAEQYSSMPRTALIGKGTLENVLNERLKEPQFELIEEITLTEDVASIERTAEPNGTSYRFIAIKVLIDTGKTTNANWTAIRARFDSRNNFEWVGEIPQTSQYSILTLKKEFGKYTFSGSTSNATTASSPVYSEYYNIANNDYVMINGVIIQRNSNYPFNSGTNIKIYGVRG